LPQGRSIPAAFTPHDAAGTRSARHRRSLWVFAFVAVGFIAARGAPQIGSVLWFSAGAGLLALALLTRGAFCRVVCAGAVVLLAAGWFQARINERPADSLARLIKADPLAEQGAGPSASRRV
jgi:hypothetical protein